MNQISYHSAFQSSSFLDKLRMCMIRVWQTYILDAFICCLSFVVFAFFSMFFVSCLFRFCVSFHLFVQSSELVPLPLASAVDWGWMLLRFALLWAREGPGHHRRRFVSVHSAGSRFALAAQDSAVLISSFWHSIRLLRFSRVTRMCTDLVYRRGDKRLRPLLLYRPWPR